MNKFYIKTFGCQMNEHDSEKMGALLHTHGFSKAGSPTEADIIVINTCSIREKSYQKALSEIGRTRKTKKERIVAVTGCVVSHDAENILKKFPYVNIALGPDHLAQLPSLVKKIMSGGRPPSGASGLVRGGTDKGFGERAVSLTDFKDLSDYEFPALISIKPVTGGGLPVKAFVTIMKGCDNTCSFCIVPLTRGKEVSRPADEVLDEIHRLEDQGVREVTLLGQNVNSYGKRLPDKTNFAQLLHRIDQQTSIARIRYTSPHPKDLSDGLVREYAQNGKLCPHIHLPVQSGSSRILKRMKRSYTRAVYLKKVEKLRKTLPDIAITTDIIVGFPGETEEDFKETLSLMKEVDYDASYSFAFSPRPGTAAATFPDDVPGELKKERLARLQDLQASLSSAKNKLRIGGLEEVLVEGPSHEGLGQLMGRSARGCIVNFNGGEDLVGAILDVEITDASPYSLKGRVLSHSERASHRAGFAGR